MKDKNKSKPSREVRHTIIKIMLSHQGESKRIPRGLLLQEINQDLFRRAMLSGKDEATQLTDRQMRGALEWLRANDPEGALICSSLKGGYFLAKDQAELEENLAADESRAYTTLQRISAQRRAARANISPQLEMPL